MSGTFVVLVGLDLITDFGNGGSGTHLLVETVLFAISGAFFVLGLKQLTQAKKEVKALRVDVEKLHQEKEQWKDETHQLLAGLSVLKKMRRVIES